MPPSVDARTSVRIVESVHLRRAASGGELGVRGRLVGQSVWGLEPLAASALCGGPQQAISLGGQRPNFL